MIAEVGSILMLHRVAPYESGELAFNEDLKISPEELRQVIRELKTWNVDFVSLDDLQKRISGKIKASRSAVAITLDDGYKDNLQYALPIFREENTPCCIYVTNSFPNRTSNLWWYALEKLIVQNQTLTFPPGNTLDNGSREAKCQNFLLLRKRILEDRYEDPLDFLATTGGLDFDLTKQRDEKCLSWDEVKYLSGDPLITIGAHTVNHFPLSRLSRRVAHAEVADSRIELEERIGKPVVHLAFPFGEKAQAHRREYTMAKAAGFSTATTALHGYVYQHDNLRCLPRIFLRPLRNNSLSLSGIMARNWKDRVKFAIRVLLSQ